jgi:hypothetical protein
MLAVARFNVAITSEGMNFDLTWQGFPELSLVAAETGIQNGDLNSPAIDTCRVPSVNA